jgi:hypothetical protein
MAPGTGLYVIKSLQYSNSLTLTNGTDGSNVVGRPYDSQGEARVNSFLSLS